jgi:hypothetical protein
MLDQAGMGFGLYVLTRDVHFVSQARFAVVGADGAQPNQPLLMGELGACQKLSKGTSSEGHFFSTMLHFRAKPSILLKPA